jgi:CheY-like chemotaxis protein
MVEDNSTDIFLTREILSESEKNYYKISTVKDGIDALSLTRKWHPKAVIPTQAGIQLRRLEEWMPD